MPTRLRHLLDAVQEAFSDPRGWLFAVLGALLVLLSAMLLPSLALLRFIFNEPVFDGRLKAVTAAQVVWNSRVILTHDGRWSLLLMAGLFGLDTALISHYMRRQIRLGRAAGTSAAGVMIGLLGVGCASCGSVLLSSLFGAGAAFGALSWLPLHGQELTWLGVLAVAASVFGVAGKIVAPEACAIPRR